MLTIALPHTLLIVFQFLTVSNFYVLLLLSRLCHPTFDLRNNKDFIFILFQFLIIYFKKL